MGLAEFTAKLYSYRRQAGLNQGDLADRVGFAASTFSRRLSGDGNSFSVQEVCAIIQALAEDKILTTYQEANELLRLLYPAATLTEAGWKQGELSPIVITDSKPEPKKSSLLVEKRVKYALNALTPVRQVLPPRPNPALIGREVEIAQLIELLTYPDIRLVTLKGMGGIGKTSLGIEALHQLAKPEIISTLFSDGVTFVPLAHVTTTRLLITTLLGTVDLTLATTANGSEISPRDRLINFLSDKSMLIMLDNFEQLLGVNVGSGELEENPRLFLSNLLQAAPGLKLLVTSTERLRLQSEQVFLVKPLGFPKLVRDISTEASQAEIISLLQEYPAVKLFYERAIRESTDFELTAQNIRDICTVCYYLDGVPLAIKLAAARIDEFSPHIMLADYLASSPNERAGLELLAKGACDTEERHQSIEGAFNWAYKLLTEKEQIVFRKLSVFEGGFSIEAVTGICTEIANRREVGLLLSSLVDKSLVNPLTDGNEARYTLMTTAQEYGCYLLDKLGELKRAREQHAEYFLELVRQAEPHLTAAGRSEWQEKLKLEYYNLIQALAELTATNQIEEAIELAGILAHLWTKFGAKSLYMKEGREWLAKIIALGQNNPNVPPAVLAKALHQAGKLATVEKDSVTAKLVLNQAIDLWRKAKNTRGLAFSLVSLGTVYYTQPDYLAAEKFYNEAEKLVKKLKDSYSLSICQVNLANIASMKRDYTRAKALYESALVLKRELNNQASVALILKNLGAIALKTNRLDESEMLFRESLELYQFLANASGTIEIWINFGKLAYLRSDSNQARKYYKNALTKMVELTNFYCLPFALMHLGLFLLDTKTNLPAITRLYAAMGEWVKTPNTQIDLEDETVYNSGVAILKQRTNLNTSELELEENWQAGIALASDLHNLALEAISLLG